MNTKTAATTAHVTPRTIQAWARCGAITAVKVNGRWDIDENSLARRIQLDARTITVAAVQVDRYNRFAVTGRRRDLERALKTGTPVTIATGICAGDSVHLGLRGTTYGDYGVTSTFDGIVARYADGRAACLIDTARLASAPALAHAIGEREETAARAEAEAAAADHAYLYPDYE